MSSIIKGRDLMLFVKGKSIAFATSHSLSISMETTETTSKDSGGKWVASNAGKISWEMSTENLYSNDGEGVNFDELFKLMTAQEPIEAVFTLEKNYKSKADEVSVGGWLPSTTGTYSGKVIITSLSASAPNEDNATFSATFTGTGALKQTPLTSSGGGVPGA